MATLVLGTNFESYSEWTASGTVSAGTGRTGAGVRLVGNATLALQFPVSGESDTLTLGFAFKTSTIGTAEPIAILRSDSGSQSHITIWYLTTGALEARRSSTVLATSSTGLIAINTWYFIEVQCKMHDSTGFVTVRRNGSGVISFPAGDTKNAGSKAVFDNFALAINTPATADFDDCYIIAGSDGVFKGDVPWPSGDARVARIDQRIVVSAAGVSARLAQINLRALTQGTSAARLAQVSLRALIGPTPLVTDHPATITSNWGSWTATAIGDVEAGGETHPATSSTTWGGWTATATASIDHPATSVTTWENWTATATGFIPRDHEAFAFGLWEGWASVALGSVTAGRITVRSGAGMYVLGSASTRVLHTGTARTSMQTAKGVVSTEKMKRSPPRSTP